MIKKNIIKIINEEISEFDYLGNDAQIKEEELLNLLKNEDFQKQFICDILLRKRNIKQKVSDSRIGGDYDNDEPTYLTLEYFVDYEYQYDIKKEPINFKIDFTGDNVSINVNSSTDAGNYHTPASTDAYYTNIEWNDINVNMFTVDGNEIEFVAFKKAPTKIQELFIRENIEDFISNQTYETDYLKRDRIQNIPYC